MWKEDTVTVLERAGAVLTVTVVYLGLDYVIYVRNYR
jgi:hypothetical protein